MTARRTFLKTASLGGVSLAVSTQASAGKSALPSGKLCVLVYGKSRRRLPAGAASNIVALALPSLDVKHVASSVPNLHGLFQAGEDARELWGIGHESPELLDVFDRNLNRIEVRTYPGIRFRGHGVHWKGGLLVAAERSADPMAGGLLLHMDTKGRVLAQYPSGGLRPHDLVVCGDYLAVAHYGHRPKPGSGTASPGNPQPGFTPSGRISPGASSLQFDVISPGVAFLGLTNLDLAAFHRLPGDAAISHLGATAQGQVMAMGINTVRTTSLAELYRLAERDGATLLPSEWFEHGYETYSPMYCVDPRHGVVGQLDVEASRMRRGQSFSNDPSSGLVAATYAASQTLYVQKPGHADRWLSTLEFGVPNPRGCALLPGTPWVAVSGNDDNIALVDVHTGKLEKLVGLPLGGHSHMFWLPA